MRFLLFSSLILGTVAFPMCTNGRTPLMEENDAYTCDRGCPLGFSCEYQDADYILSKAICCPNITALELLYGEEEHSDPIWDLSEVATISLGLQHAAENASVSPILPENSLTDDTVTVVDSGVPSNYENIVTKTKLGKSNIELESTTTSNLKNTEAVQMTIDEQQLKNPAAAVFSSTPMSVEGSGESPNTSSIRKSCARQKFSLSCHNGTVKTQATIRWWINSETGDCQYYPFGYCPGDRIIESVTIRTRKECQEQCLQTTQDFENAIASFDIMTNLNDSKSKEHLEIAAGTPIAINIGIEDAEIEKKHESSNGLPKAKQSDGTDIVKGNKLNEINVSPRTIEDPAVEQKHENISGIENTIIPFMLTEKEHDMADMIRHATTTSNLLENEMILNSSKKQKEEMIPSNSVNEKIIVNEIARSQTIEKTKVACSSSPYRYVCSNGHPTQFVYRWEMIEGVCQSFPYGYCYEEFNHPHPRTEEECFYYCGTAEKAFSL